MQTDDRILLLRQQATATITLLSSITKAQASTSRDRTLHHCAYRALELTAGCVQLTERKLPAASTIITRAFLDLLFLAAWLQKSEDNSIIYESASEHELKRQARLITSLKYGQFIDTTSGRNVTKKVLSSTEFRNIRQRLKSESMASESGLEEIYKTIYGYISMIAHTNDYALSNTNDSATILAACTETAISVLKAIHLIFHNWSNNRTVTPPEEILKIWG